MIDKLNFSPLRDSYTPDLGNEVITTTFKAGMPRQRRAFIGAPHTASVTFRLKKADHNTLMAFYYSHQTKPFGLQLFAIDGELKWYECRFLSAPKPRQLGATVYDTSVDIVIAAKPYE